MTVRVLTSGRLGGDRSFYHTARSASTSSLRPLWQYIFRAKEQANYLASLGVSNWASWTRRLPFTPSLHCPNHRFYEGKLSSKLLFLSS